MKRFFIISLMISIFFLTGCSSPRTDITREEIVAAYEDAGYIVSSKVYEEKSEHGQIAYVQADHPEGDYIYFAIFETPEEAEANKKEFYHPVMTGLFSVIYGQPSWQRWEVHGCIVAQYDDPEFYKIFQNLLEEK